MYLDMSVSDQQEGSRKSPEQGPPQQRKYTETGRATGRGAFTYTVYHFHQLYPKR